MTTSPTDGVRTARPSRREALTSRRFVLHYLQMLAAMLAGMALLMPVSMLVGPAPVSNCRHCSWRRRCRWAWLL